MANRKRSLLPIILFCVLLTLVVAKVIASFSPVQLTQHAADTPVAAAPEESTPPDPSKIRIVAQLLPPSQAAIAQQTVAIPPTCSDTPAEEKKGLVPTCEQNSVNTADYITPSCSGGSCGALNGSSVTLVDSNIGNVVYEGVDLGGGMFMQKSNNIYFIYRHTGDGIGLLQDTIWGGGPSNGSFVCQEDPSRQAFYRVTNAAGQEGNSQYPAKAICGVPHSNQSKLKTFYKENPDNGFDINGPDKDKDPYPDESKLKTCTVPGQTDILTTNTDRMIFQGSATCMGVPFEMIAMENTGGAGAGEVNMYCKGKGLCAFYQSLDYSKTENQPQNWKGKDLCKLSAGGSRGSLPTYFEYNIQRECYKTPEKVLNNFVDEYSVSCVPQAQYILDLVRAKKCDKVGCDGWNAPGELRFSAGGTLFGLFRNENIVKNRYNTMNGLKDKDRQESIESYFTAKAKDLPTDALKSNTTLTDYNKAASILLGAYQSPLYKLSTLEQQCGLVFDKLRAVKELCDPFNRIEGEEASECAINQFLPNTSLRYIDMLNRMTNKSDGTGSTSSCEALMNPLPADTNGNELKDQILSVDPAMEVAYRPAFVVLATLVGNEEPENPKFTAQGADGKFYQVDYMEVKVPTFGSDFLNKQDSSTASNKNRAGSTYRDPLRATADLITPLSIQNMFKQEEQNDRQAIRTKAASLTPPADPGSGPVPPGDIIGLGGVKIRCRTGVNQYDENGCDNIAKALITFINSSNVVPTSPGAGEDGKSVTREFSPPRGWLPANKCEVDEASLYGNKVLTDNPVAEKYQVAEQGTTIGSKLEAVNVGQYNDKKKDAYASVNAEIPKLDEAENSNFGHTQIFFVSPHNYTLLYAQSAFLSLMTLDQQKNYLQNANFNSVLKTNGLDSFTGAEDKRVYYTEKGTGEDGPRITEAQAIATGGDENQVSARMDRKSENSKLLDSPLMWQVGGSIANLPTRAFTLITTKVNEVAHLFTLGCNGPYATENWLLNRCNAVTPEQAAKDPNDIPQTPVGDKCIAIKMSDKTEAAAAYDFMMTNLPIQHLGADSGSTTFVGWDKYFGIPVDRRTSQHLFYNDCNGGELCIKYILDEVAKTDINPYLAMAIALNESGGLYSVKPGFVGPHFGCGPGGAGTGAVQKIGDDTIENKLRCMINTLNNDIDKSPDEALGTSGGYGYPNGSRNDNLVKLVGYLSKGAYPKSCSDTGTPTTVVTP